MIRRGGLSGRVFLVTDYDVISPTLIESKRRHDVTEEIEAFMRSEGWIPPEVGA